MLQHYTAVKQYRMFSQSLYKKNGTKKNVDKSRRKNISEQIKKNYETRSILQNQKSGG